MCEFAMQVVDEHLDDEPTIEQVTKGLFIKIQPKATF